MLKIRVPATSANLSVGFDTLGIALNIYNEFGFEKVLLIMWMLLRVNLELII